MRRPMSTLRRTLLGGLVGAVVAPAAFFCFAVLGAAVCSRFEERGETNARGLAELAAWASLIFGPPIGSIGGAVWAFRRGRRKESPAGPS